MLTFIFGFGCFALGMVVMMIICSEWICKER